MIRHITADPVTRTVLVDGTPLDPLRSQKLRNHSLDGFNWGYHGSGPAQLALALLLVAVDEIGLNGDSFDWVCRHYQHFKCEVVATWPQGQPVDVQLDLREWLSSRILDGVKKHR